MVLRKQYKEAVFPKHSDDDKRHIQTKGQVRALRNSWNGAKVNQQTLGVIKSELAGYSTL